MLNSLAKPIHIWSPGIRDDTGGIQAFSRSFVRALVEAHPNRLIRVFVRNEALSPGDDLLTANVKIHSFERVPVMLRSPALALCGIWFGIMERPACTLSTHLHFLPAMRLLRRLLSIPYAGVLHGIEAWTIRSRSRVQGMLHADRLLAVSQFTREKVISTYHVDPARVSVFPNTYDEKSFKPGPKPERLLKKYGLRSDQPVLLTVSRLALSERYKGHWQMLIALRAIRQQMEDVHYLVVGTGDELAHLRAGVRVMGLEENVTFAGFVAAEDLADHYRLCDVFVMPSTREGFGIVFLEAAACGKPVIAGCLDGSVDAVDGGKLGILVDPHDPTQITGAVLAALRKSHPNTQLFQPERLSSAVEERFGFRSFKRQLIAEVDGLIGGVTTPAVVAGTPVAVLKPGARAPRIVVLTQLNSPYQVEFFNRVARAGDCHLEVIYLTSSDSNRQWAAPDIGHSHLILSETPHLRANAMESLLSADLVVFNYYTNLFALRALRARAETGKAWAFWGERPGFLQLGPLGMWFRTWALLPLHRSRASIWGVGAFGIEGYRREFGGGHVYENLPYYSELRRFQTTRSLRAGPRTVLFSGSLSERKGADFLARAFAQVASEDPTIRLCVVGSGPLRAEMETILAPCADRVEWAGFQNWQDLPKFYAKADLFCFPSRYDGWGLALVEALASGLPAIATDQTGAAIDLISHGRNGWLVKADDQTDVTTMLRKAAALPPESLLAMQLEAQASVKNFTIVEGVRNFRRAADQTLSQWSNASEVPGGEG